jgi:hypothetical protein
MSIPRNLGNFADNVNVNGKVEVTGINATGTPSSTTALFGDGTWQSVSVTPAGVSDQNNTSTGYFDLPTGTTAERPASPTVGMSRYNTTLGTGEMYTSAGWLSFPEISPIINTITGNIYFTQSTSLTLNGSNFGSGTGTVNFVCGVVTANVSATPSSTTSVTVATPSQITDLSAGSVVIVSFTNALGKISNGVNTTVLSLPTGGTITIANNYRIHTFTSSSSLITPTGFTATAQYLVIGGGGSGGTYTPSVNYAYGNDGQSSSFIGGAISITSIGGGGGGAQGGGPFSGGSGGGGSGYGGTNVRTGGSGTTGQGYAGGDGGNGNPPYSSGGGGGAGALGGTAGTGGTSGTGAGNGGVGVQSSITGTAIYRGGGGGGALTQSAQFLGLGGNGGGGGGGNGAASVLAGSGTVNTGGGGGGSDSGIGAGQGGGGAGGYRCSVTGELSGGGGSAESTVTLASNTVYTITVGGGGAAIGAGGGASGAGGSGIVIVRYLLPT